MSEVQEELSPWPRLECDCIGYRAVLNGPGINKHTRQILTVAFLRRGPHPTSGELRDQEGLSLALVMQPCSIEEIVDIVKAGYSICHAVGSLHIGKIRDIATESPIDVVRDAESHANIIGLPAYGEDVAKAERLAGQLAKLSRCLWVK